MRAKLLDGFSTFLSAAFSRVVEGADPYRLCHVRIDALEANDSSSVSLAYSASLRGKFALQTLRLPPSPIGEGSV